jgi:hypothetical protein
MNRLVRVIWRYCYAAMACLYMLTIGQLRSKDRGFLYQICERYGNRPVRTRIPVIRLDAVVASDVSVQLEAPTNRGGEVSLTELLVIAALVRQRQPQVMLEIGTLDGRTALNLAANSAEHARVFTLDLPDQPGSGARFTGTAFAAKITQLLGDSATFDYTALRNAVDFVFIDANHSDQNVTSDSLRALELLREGHGCIVWHDYDTWDWPSATRALNRLFVDRSDFGMLRRIEGTSLVYLIRE